MISSIIKEACIDFVIIIVLNDTCCDFFDCNNNNSRESIDRFQRLKALYNSVKEKHTTQKYSHKINDINIH